MADHSTERVNKFLKDFGDEFEEYLANRPKPFIYWKDIEKWEKYWVFWK